MKESKEFKNKTTKSDDIFDFLGDEFLDNDDNIQDEILDIEPKSIKNNKINIRKEKKQKESYNKQSKIKKNQRNKKENKRGKLVILPIILILTIVISITIIPNMIKQGIAYKGNTLIDDMTYSQLMAYSFEVKNKSKKDISEYTEWYLNNRLFASGTNITSLNMDYIRWGQNDLIISNSQTEDKISVAIILNKDINTNDNLHNILSSMYKYPEIMYDKTNFIYASDEEISSQVFNQRDSRRMNNGTYKTKQNIGDITLITDEISGYSLNIGNCINYKNNENLRAIEIYGNWDNVINAELEINLNNYDNIQIIRLGKTQEVITDGIIYIGDKAKIGINQSGTYIIQFGYMNSTNIENNYNIVYIDLSKNTDNDTIIKDFINNRFEYNIENNNISYTEYSKENYDEQKNISEIAKDIVDNIYTTMNHSLMNNKIDIFIDIRGLEYKDINSICEELSNIPNYETNIIFLNTNIIGIKTMKNWNGTTNIIEITDLKELETQDNLLKINFDIKETNEINGILPDIENIEFENEDIQVIKVGDSGINWNRDISKVTKAEINSITSVNNSTGINLLTKLIYEKKLDKDIFEDDNYTNLSYAALSEFGELNKISNKIDNIIDGQINKNIILTEKDISNLNETGIVNNDNNYKDIADVLSINIFNKGTKLVNLDYIGTSVNKSMADLINKLNNRYPIMAEIENEYGNTSILITKVYREVNTNVENSVENVENSDIKYYTNTFYIEYYNPMNSEIPQIGKLVGLRDISESGELGYRFEFLSIDNDISYNKLWIYNSEALNK